MSYAEGSTEQQALLYVRTAEQASSRGNKKLAIEQAETAIKMLRNCNTEEGRSYKRRAEKVLKKYP